MAKVVLDMAISIDGCIGGPGGADVGLYDWYFDPVGRDREIVDELAERTGAMILGRGAFGTGDDAAGWDDSPYRVPHFVLTHRPPQRRREGPIEFRFVTDGIDSALKQAREASGEAWVTLAGGADVARQYLAAGLVDEVQLHVVPVVVGAGQRLFDGTGGTSRWDVARVVEGADVTHLLWRRPVP